MRRFWGRRAEPRLDGMNSMRKGLGCGVLSADFADRLAALPEVAATVRLGCQRLGASVTVDLLRVSGNLRFQRSKAVRICSVFRVGESSQVKGISGLKWRRSWS